MKILINSISNKRDMCNPECSSKNKCSSKIKCSADPFHPVNGTITPFLTTINCPQYSVKIVTKKNKLCQEEKVNIYTGKFPADINDNSIGFQAVIMKALETAFKNLLNESFVVGPLPTLGKPITYTFNPNDILVSFANRNDYFVFNGSGAARQVIFIKVGSPDEIYLSGINPISPTFFSNGISYTVLHPSDSDFTITDYNGNILNKTSAVVSYNGSNLTINTTHPDGTITYRNNPYTEVGVTLLPGVLPSNPNNIIVAEGVKGIFYNENAVSPAALIDYIILNNPTLTPQINLSVEKVIKSIFTMARNAVQHSLNIPNQDSFSTQSGFGGFVSIGCLCLEIRISR